MILGTSKASLYDLMKICSTKNGLNLLGHV